MPGSLRAVVGDAIGIDRDDRRRRADGQAADLVGRGEIALEQRRRQLEHTGDVVEAVARIVAGQQARHVDVDGDEIADGVAILVAIQPVERHGASGVRRVGRRAVELVFEPREDAVRFLGGRPRPTVVRRHHAGRELADHALPRGGVGSDRVHVERLEREIGLALGVVVALEAVAFERRALRRGQLLARWPARHQRRRQ
jgi:hypothetical protein